MNQRRGFLDDLEPDIRPAAPLPPPPERGWVAGVEGAAGPVRHAAPTILPTRTTQDRLQPLTIAAGALVLLIGGVALLELANFASAQFDKSPLLGWLTVALIGPPAAALAWSCVREWRGYASLRTVGRIRTGLQSDDIEVARRHARAWLRAIGASDDVVRGVMERSSDPATVRALLRAGPLARIDQQAAQAGRTAAVQILAATAVSPWPGLDGVLVVWRGLRLIRRIAELYGMRPGTLGTLRLWRRVAMDAGSVAAADVVVATMTDALFSSPLGGALAGQASGSAIAAQRMLRLSVAVARSCRPIDESIA